MKKKNIQIEVEKLSKVDFLGSCLLTKIEEKKKYDDDGKEVKDVFIHVLTILPDDGDETLKVTVTNDLPKELELRTFIDFANARVVIKPKSKGTFQGQTFCELDVTATAESVIILDIPPTNKPVENNAANNKPKGNGN